MARRPRLSKYSPATSPASSQEPTPPQSTTAALPPEMSATLSP